MRYAYGLNMKQKTCATKLCDWWDLPCSTQLRSMSFGYLVKTTQVDVSTVSMQIDLSHMFNANTGVWMFDAGLNVWHQTSRPAANIQTSLNVWCSTFRVVWMEHFKNIIDRKFSPDWIPRHRTLTLFCCDLDSTSEKNMHCMKRIVLIFYIFMRQYG